MNCIDCEDTGFINKTGEVCQVCCEHEFDPDEGFICINCDLQGEPSDVYDEDYGQDR